MITGSRLTISAEKYRHNIQVLRSLLNTGTRLSSVVKGNAYGHGVPQVIPLAESCGIDHFTVYSASEAREVADVARDDSDILILGDLTGDEMEWAVQTGVHFAVFDRERLGRARDVAASLGRAAKVHLEIETGMNRTGLRPDELERVADDLRTHASHFDVEGAFTHYAGAESEANYLRVRKQIRTFHKRIARLRELGVRPRLLHTAGSAATITYPETHMDLVRVGIAQYGFWPSQETRMRYLIERSGPALPDEPDPLQRIIRWISSVMSVQTVPPGQFIGYGTSYLTTREQRIATIPVGYSHGFPRVLSNLGFVLVRGVRAPVVGVVNMNCTTLDVTEIPDVEVGDEVVLIGRQGHREISVGWFGDLTRSLNYEVLVRIPREIPRSVQP